MTNFLVIMHLEEIPQLKMAGKELHLQVQLKNMINIKKTLVHSDFNALLNIYQKY